MERRRRADRSERERLGGRSARNERKTQRDGVRHKRLRRPAEVRRMRKKRRRLRMIPFVLILLLCTYLVHAYVDQTRRIAKLRKEKAELVGAQVDLENEIKSLELDFKNRDSLEFIEKVAREKLGMVKANEEVYVDINMRDPRDLPPEKEDDKKTDHKEEETMENQESQSSNTDHE